MALFRRRVQKNALTKIYFQAAQGNLEGIKELTNVLLLYLLHRNRYKLVLDWLVTSEIFDSNAMFSFCQ